MMDFLIERVAMPLIMGVCVLLLIGVMIALAYAATSDKIVLIKAEWTCAEERTVTQPMLVGKAVIPQTRQECVAYRRR